MNIVRKTITNFLIFIIAGLRPILGPAACKYPVGCVEFAIHQLETEMLHKAFWHIGKRVFLCNPFNRNIE